MTKRLTVVLSQSRNRGSAQRGCEEELVPLLLMEPNIDVVVIPHLEDIRPGDTGHLCLEGITGPLVFVSWLHSHEAHRLLNRYGVRGRPGRTVFDPQVAVESNDRAIYFLSLADGVPVDRIVSEIRRIRDDVLVSTVPLVGLLSPGQVTARRATSDPAEVPSSTSQASAALKPALMPLESSEQPAAVVTPAGVEETNSTAHQTEQQFDEKDFQLDKLLTELDRFME